MSIDELRARLEKAMPKSKVAVDDLTGTGDHFQVTIVSSEFEGLAPLERHRLVYKHIGEDVGGAIHALSIQAYTQKQWDDRTQEIKGE